MTYERWCMPPRHRLLPARPAIVPLLLATERLFGCLSTPYAVWEPLTRPMPFQAAWGDDTFPVTLRRPLSPLAPSGPLVPAGTVAG
jgi:hypothetical protein